MNKNTKTFQSTA